MPTLKQIRKKLNDLADAHLQISKFIFYEDAQEDNIMNGVDKFPFMGAILQPGSLAPRLDSMKFVLFFSDLVNSDNSNRTEVLNDMRLVAQDIFSQLFEWCQVNRMKLVLETPFSHFVENKEHNTAGWQLDISINQIFARDTCQVPSTQGPATEEPGSSFIINQDGEIIYRLNPGQSYTVTELTTLLQTLTDPAPTTIIQNLT